MRGGGEDGEGGRLGDSVVVMSALGRTRGAETHGLVCREWWNEAKAGPKSKLGRVCWERPATILTEYYFQFHPQAAAASFKGKPS